MAFLRMLNELDLGDKKDYEFFATKYPMNGELTKQGEKIEAMDKWCKEMNIQFQEIRLFLVQLIFPSLDKSFQFSFCPQDLSQQPQSQVER